MTIAEFDHFSLEKKKELLLQCCGSSAWITRMLAEPAFEDLVDIMEVAEEKWYECNEADWLEAFEHHPQIGDVNSLKEKFASTKEWVSAEQSGVNSASQNILQQLTDTNKKYRERFGYIFIVCATGRSAEEMLGLIQRRMNNSPEEEIKIAMAEQNKITKLRLEKLFR